MILRIEAVGSSDRLLISSRPLEEHRRPRQAIFDPDERRGKRTVTICSWCGRARDSSEWMEIEQAARDLDLTGTAPLPAVRHDLCDRCVLVLSAT
jgi:hypothetical protein